jgi:hypothetical protein
MLTRLLSPFRATVNSASSPDAVAALRRRRDLLAIAVLVLCAWALHGHGLTLGFWFDDHNHLELCRKNGFGDLAAGNRFDWTGRLTHVWWAGQETGWAYYRPLTVAMRTAQLDVFGLNPLPFHVVHLTIFSLSLVLFYILLRRCGWGAGPSCFAGMFFLLHPANAFTMPWLANDGPVLVGLWLVLGLLLLHESRRAGHRRLGLLACILLCYVLALLSRENGIVLGPVFVLFDFLSPAARPAVKPGETPAPPPTWRRRWALYGALTLIGLAYLPLRSWSLGPAPAPRSPYFHWPTEPGFVAWLPYKIINDLFCLPSGVPFVPIVDVPWWQARPLTTAAAALVVAALAVGLLMLLRRSKAAWGVLGGVVLVQAPTLLAFSAPYNYYLATAGWAVLLTMAARRLWRTRPRSVVAGSAALATWYLAGLWGGAWMLHSAARTEALVRADVMADRPAEYPHGTRLFFLNLPFFAAEVGPALRNSADRPDLEVYPLTFSPELFYPNTDVAVEQESDHTLLVRSHGAAFFSGEFGDRIQMGWYGASRTELKTGPFPIRPAAGPMPFRVEVIEADAGGVQALRFTFDRPLNDPTYRFFLGSPRAFAEELHFPQAAPSPDLTPDDSATVRDMERVRRMQIACGRIFELLARWPF